MTWLAYPLILACAVALAYALRPRPWSVPEMRVLESLDGAGFRLQYRVRALWHSYWVDVEHVRSAGRSLPWVYPTREMAESMAREVRRRHELRDPRRWQ